MLIQGADGVHAASFSLGNRLLRGLWGVVWLMLFRPSPRPLHAWRAALLRVFGARIGRHVHIYPGVKIWAPWNLQIGDECGVGSGANLYSMAKITLGNRCVLSQGAHLCCGSHDYESANFQLVAKPIDIGDYVWICAEAFVGPGVTVLAGSVVGARAVLMRSTTEAWHVWAGHPAAMGRKRMLKTGGPGCSTRSKPPVAP